MCKFLFIFTLGLLIFNCTSTNLYIASPAEQAYKTSCQNFSDTYGKTPLLKDSLTPIDSIFIISNGSGKTDSAAVFDAKRIALEKSGILMSSQTTVKNLMLTKDVVKSTARAELLKFDRISTAKDSLYRVVIKAYIVSKLFLNLPASIATKCGLIIYPLYNDSFGPFIIRGIVPNSQASKFIKNPFINREFTRNEIQPNSLHRTGQNIRAGDTLEYIGHIPASGRLRTMYEDGNEFDKQKAIMQCKMNVGPMRPKRDVSLDILQQMIDYTGEVFVTIYQACPPEYSPYNIISTMFTNESQSIDEEGTATREDAERDRIQSGQPEYSSSRPQNTPLSVYHEKTSVEKQVEDSIFYEQAANKAINIYLAYNKDRPDRLEMQNAADLAALNFQKAGNIRKYTIAKDLADIWFKINIEPINPRVKFDKNGKIYYPRPHQLSKKELITLNDLKQQNIDELFVKGN
jgi:hypothetical protein